MLLMSIKTFLTLIYGLAGLLIASVTAFVTFWIIGEPIGYKMTSKIVVTVAVMVPLIIVLSVLIGGVFSRHIGTVAARLHAMAEGDYTMKAAPTRIREFETMNEAGTQLATEIRTLIGSLKEHNETLKMMLMTLSHDMKTPVMIANGYLEELEDGMIAEADLPRVYTKLMAENNYINALCDEILRYQDSQQMYAYENTPLQVRTLGDEVIALLDAPVSNEIRPEFRIRFHETDLKQILMNLFHNALKYARGTMIRVYDDGAALVVEDAGGGIAPAERERIFEPFYTVDASKNRRTSGYGLGLAIVGNLCRRNHCNITIDAAYDAGTRFVISRQEEAA